MQKPKTDWLRFLNHGLSVAVSVLALYILLAPFLPNMTWWLRHSAPVKVIGHAKTVTLPKPTPQNAAPAPQTDELLIPRLGMEEAIHGGKTIRSLRLGVWHLPYSSTPEAGGNTVLVGHRFTYAGPAVFYHLDKVQKGDHVGIWWGGKAYEYEVYNIEVVPPTEVSVETKNTEPRLTIYTCTPLWNPKDRLVIQAHPVEATQ